MVFLVVDDLKERNGNEKQRSELSYYPYIYIITHGMASYGK